MGLKSLKSEDFASVEGGYSGKLFFSAIYFIYEVSELFEIWKYHLKMMNRSKYGDEHNNEPTPPVNKMSIVSPIVCFLPSLILENPWDT